MAVSNVITKIKALKEQSADLAEKTAKLAEIDESTKPVRDVLKNRLNADEIEDIADKVIPFPKKSSLKVSVTKKPAPLQDPIAGPYAPHLNNIIDLLNDIRFEAETKRKQEEKDELEDKRDRQENEREKSRVMSKISGVFGDVTSDAKKIGGPSLLAGAIAALFPPLAGLAANFDEFLSEFGLSLNDIIPTAEQAQEGTKNVLNTLGAASAGKGFRATRDQIRVLVHGKGTAATRAALKALGPAGSATRKEALKIIRNLGIIYDPKVGGFKYPGGRIIPITAIKKLLNARQTKNVIELLRLTRRYLPRVPGVSGMLLKLIGGALKLFGKAIFVVTRIAAPFLAFLDPLFAYLDPNASQADFERELAGSVGSIVGAFIGAAGGPVGAIIGAVGGEVVGQFLYYVFTGDFEGAMDYIMSFKDLPVAAYNYLGEASGENLGLGFGENAEIANKKYELNSSIFETSREIQRLENLKRGRVGFGGKTRPTNTPFTEKDAQTLEELKAKKIALEDDLQSMSTRPTEDIGGRQAKFGSAQEKMLLDFVANKESDGSYTKVYGGADVLELTNMTLREVLEAQRKKTLPFADDKSTAVGRYQFIYDSLKEEIEQMGIDLETKFTPETQDRLILHRLKRFRKLNDFLSGKISPRAFQAHLANEFASIPNPDTGRSAYHGIAGNRSLVGNDETSQFLTGLQSRKFASLMNPNGAPVENTVPPKPPAQTNTPAGTSPAGATVIQSQTNVNKSPSPQVQPQLHSSIDASDLWTLAP